MRRRGQSRASGDDRSPGAFDLALLAAGALKAISQPAAIAKMIVNRARFPLRRLR